MCASEERQRQTSTRTWALFERDRVLSPNAGDGESLAPATAPPTAQNATAPAPVGLDKEDGGEKGVVGVGVIVIADALSRFVGVVCVCAVCACVGVCVRAGVCVCVCAEGVDECSGGMPAFVSVLVSVVVDVVETGVPVIEIVAAALVIATGEAVAELDTEPPAAEEEEIRAADSGEGMRMFVCVCVCVCVCV